MGASDDSHSDSDDSAKDGIFVKKGKTIADEEKRLKQQFKEQAVASDSGDDLLVKKPKRKDSSASSQEAAPEPEEEGERLVTDKDLLARFYGDNSSLDPTERFLRNYILNEGWR